MAERSTDLVGLQKESKMVGQSSRTRQELGRTRVTRFSSDAPGGQLEVGSGLKLANLLPKRGAQKTGRMCKYAGRKFVSNLPVEALRRSDLAAQLADSRHPQYLLGSSPSSVTRCNA